MPPIQWTLEKIRSGFEEFYKLQNRYPTALEVDQYKFLPSSRQIQRKFGGLKKLKTELGLPSDTLDFSQGSHRSNLAKRIGKRGKNFERDIYSLLVSKFGEIFVHAEKPFNNHSGRIDFFIYCDGYKFGVDVFFADNLHNLAGCINLKTKIYRDIDFDIVFLSVNPIIHQNVINKHLNAKLTKLPPYIKVLTVDGFKKYINNIKPHNN